MALEKQATSAVKIAMAGAFVLTALSPAAPAQMSGMAGMSGMSGQYPVAPDGSTYLFPSGTSGMDGMSGMGGAHYDKWKTWQRPFQLENPRRLYGK